MTMHEDQTILDPPDIELITSETQRFAFARPSKGDQVHDKI